MDAVGKPEDYTIEIARDEVTGLPRWMIIRLNGKFHSLPDDRPAHVVFDEQGRPYQMTWYHEGLPHRSNGPARIRVNPDNGVTISEEYKRFGVGHRSVREPAYIERDPKTGAVLCQEFYFNGGRINPNVAAKLKPDN